MSRADTSQPYGMAPHALALYARASYNAIVDKMTAPYAKGQIVYRVGTGASYEITAVDTIVPGDPIYTLVPCRADTDLARITSAVEYHAEEIGDRFSRFQIG